MSDFAQMPGMDPMGNTLKFMKEMWGGVKTPGVSLPSLSVEDLDKQIADLKAVEGWLALNMQMLKATIQTLEVQRATLAALQSMGQNMGASMGQSMEKAVDAAMGAAGAIAASMNPMAAAGPFNTAPAEAPPAAKPHEAREAPQASAFNFSFAPPQADKPQPPPAEDEPPTESAADSANSANGADTLAGAAAPFVDPAAWWGLLQNQFKQAMETASAIGGAQTDVRPVRRPAAKKAAGKTAAKSARKTAAKAPGKTSRKAAAGHASRAAPKSARKVSAKPASKKAAKTAKPKSRPARKS